MEEKISRQVEKLREQDEKVLAELKKGNNRTKITIVLNLDRKSVNASIRRLINNGIITSKEIIMYQEVAIDKVVLELVKKRYPITQINAITNIGYNDIVASKERLVARGELDEKELNLKTRVRSEKKEKLLELLKSGMTRKEASETLGVSRGTVYEYTEELIREGRIKKEEINFEKCGRKRNENVERHENFEVELEQEREKVEQKVAELLQAGLNLTQISREFEISQRKIRPIVDKVVREGRVKAPEQSIIKHTENVVLPEVEIEENDDISLLYRSRTALESIYNRTREGKIDNKTKKLCFMYCQNIVQEGIALKDKELELLTKTIAKGEGPIDQRAIRLVAREYTRRENLVPAIEMIDECLKRNSTDKEMLYIKKVMQETQERIDQHNKAKMKEKIKAER